MQVESVIAALKKAPLLYGEHDAFTEQPGIYALFYKGQLRNIKGIPFRDGELLYIGKTESSQMSRDVKTHLGDGKTGSSTVRRSLGAILRQELNLEPVPRNPTDYRRGNLRHDRDPQTPAPSRPGIYPAMVSAAPCEVT
ncbi:MAG: hypothetical protein IIB17_12400 [Chloroflexi bacterium]|nr:hypothetical protein [Chloroflexota bacterium]